MITELVKVSRDFLAILVHSLLFRLGLSVTSPVLVLFARSFGASMTEIGLIALTTCLGYAFVEPIFGYISDRISRKKILVSATLVSVPITFSYTLVTSFWHFLPITFALAIMLAGVAVTRKAFIADIMGPSERGKSYGAFMALLTLGLVVGPYLGGYLAEITSYRVPFYVSCSIMLFSAIMGLMIKEVRRDDSMEATDGHRKGSVKRSSLTKSKGLFTLCTSGFMLFLIARLLQLFVQFFLMSTLPIYAMESALRATESQIGLMMSMAGVIQIPMQLVFGSLADKVGRRPLIALGALFGGLTFLGFQVISSIPQLYIMRALYGVCYVSYELAMMVYLMDCVPREKYGIAIGLYGLSEDIGGMLGPLIIGFFYDRWGFAASLYCVAGSMFLNTVISVTSFKRFKPLRARSLNQRSK